MSTALRDILDLPEMSTRDSEASSEAADRLRRQFVETMKQVNEGLRAAAAHAPKADHQKADAQRESLFSAYQKVVKKLDAGDAAADDNSQRFLAAADKLSDKAAKLANDSVANHKEWSDREGEFDDAVAKVAELTEASHPKSSALQKLVGSIKAQTNQRRFDNAVKTFKQFSPKLTSIHEQFAAAAAGPDSVSSAGRGGRRISEQERETIRNDLDEMERRLDELMAKHGITF